MGSVRHLAIAGNMGVGKSTLTGVLSDRLNARAYYETVDDHPYLERFYQDMQRWSFHSQSFFLAQAHQQQCEIQKSADLAVQDRTIYEHFHVFATSLHQQQLLSTDEYTMLARQFDSITEFLPGPDLMIYLRASVDTLIKRISVRDRSVESTVKRSYLEHLEERYEAFMDRYDASTILIVDTDDIDIFDSSDRNDLLAVIEQELHVTAQQVSGAQGVSNEASASDADSFAAVV